MNRENIKPREYKIVEAVNPIFHENHALSDRSMKLWEFVSYTFLHFVKIFTFIQFQDG